jgi:hypothetical protein
LATFKHPGADGLKRKKWKPDRFEEGSSARPASFLLALFRRSMQPAKDEEVNYSSNFVQAASAGETMRAGLRLFRRPRS